MSGPSRGRRAAHRANHMDAKKPGERTGSRPSRRRRGRAAQALSPAEHRAIANITVAPALPPQLGAARGKGNALNLADATRKGGGDRQPFNLADAGH